MSEGQTGMPEAVDKTDQRRQLEARAASAPHLRHAIASKPFTERATGFEDLDWAALTSTFGDESARTATGDLRAASNMLTAQAMTLDAVFTDMLSRSSRNLGDYPEAADRYMRLALKAQANSRATLEALMKLHQPREQTVKHVHVNAGGQAIVADQFHHHAGGTNVKNADQPHEPVPALPCPNPFGNGVPVPGSQRQETVPSARRRGRKRRTQR